VTRARATLALLAALAGCGYDLGPSSPWVPWQEIEGPLRPEVVPPPVLFVIGAGAVSEPLRVVTYNVETGRNVEALARAFEDWQRAGLLREMDAQIVAELLFSLVESALAACFVYGAGAREDDYLREAVRCVEGAVLPRPPGARDPNPTRSDPS